MFSMRELSRRNLLRQSGTLATAVALAGLPRTCRAAGANDRILLGMIGPGGHGSGLLASFVAQKDVEVVYVCDPDADRMNQAARVVEQAAGKAPKAVADLRRVLDDKEVDAVVVATPDHWHAPATILACEAGKHVYVEKPCSHNIREGRLMVEAARRNGRVVQVGTQSRSAEYIVRAMQLLREGAIGDILAAKAWNSQLRRDIGKVKPTEPPAHLDFDLWVGPTPMVPYQSNLLHSTWRWFFAFGSGDIGNDGVHDIDIARWGLGVETHPNTVAAIGGKYFFDDDQQFPDTQYVVYEYGTAEAGKKQLVYEQRLWSPYGQEGYENGNAFYGTKGMLILGKQEGWQLYGPRNERRDQMKGQLDGAVHHRDFLDCIRTGRRPHADIEIGHLSATLAHLGNIAARVRRVIHFDPQTERIVGDEEANGLVRREYRAGHWAVPKGV
ncbi:MAG: gfo/Idh/MocA family oxidoreductase [Planctomycetaceae bacterium]|nr:MAG: gfo/Idh/MocA family oxidoreductase [Planctomycetaceae bacterium]